MRISPILALLVDRYYIADLRKDDEGNRTEIFQDVVRCFPENLYFRQPSTQTMMLDILYIWSKLNPDVGYRQGMHEILSPIVWVVERSAVDESTVGERLRAYKDESIEGSYVEIFDSTFIGHDSFTIFNAIMQNLKWSYSPPDVGRQTGTGARAAPKPPIVIKSEEILQDLGVRDPELATHFMHINLAPQLFVMYVTPRNPSRRRQLNPISSGGGSGCFSGGKCRRLTACSGYGIGFS